MIACAAALVLLLDASGSIRPEEWRVQVEATAAGIEEPSVTRLIAREGGIALSAFAFSERATAMVPWRLLRNAEEAARFATELRAAPRGLALGTEIGLALEAALDALDEAPCAAEQDIIDLATDGEADERPVLAARERAIERGVRINALGVGSPEAAEWLRANAATPGGFVLNAEDWEAFPAAIRRKLSLELAGDSPPAAPSDRREAGPGSAGSRR
jgi:hypothetical protein